MDLTQFAPNVCKLMRKYLSKQFPNEFMVSIIGFTSLSIQHDDTVEKDAPMWG